MKKIFLFLLFVALCFVPYVCFPAIGYDQTTEGNAYGTSMTADVTVGDNENRILIVCWAREYGADPDEPVTFNGDEMTLVDTTTIGGSNNAVYMYYLLNPDVGTHSLYIHAGTAGYFNWGAVSLYNVAQEAPEASNKATGSGTDVSVTVNSCSDGSWVVDVVSDPASTHGFTADGTQTERWQQNRNCRGAGSTYADVSAGNIPMGWTISSSGSWGIVAASFKVYGGAPSGGVRQHSIGTGIGRGIFR